MYFSCIRHGRTQMNAEDLVCGITDIPLVELGIQQAKNASEDIYKKIQKGELPKIDLIFSSPLLRAQQTAQIIAQKLNLTYQIEERLTEQNYGKMEGCSRFDEKYLAIIIETTDATAKPIIYKPFNKISLIVPLLFIITIIFCI